MPPRIVSNGSANRLLPEDRPFHEWYRFVLSFPPHLVGTYLEKFNATRSDLVLDPFCGTGTTLVECKKRGIHSIGIEANPMAAFASRVKTDWSLSPEGLAKDSQTVAEAASNLLRSHGIEDTPALIGVQPHDGLWGLPPEATNVILTNSISPLPLHKALVLLEGIDVLGGAAYSAHERLAFAKVLVSDASNLHFGPEVGVGRPKPDAPVTTPWVRQVAQMSKDLASVAGLNPPSATVHEADARQLASVISPRTVSAVITSPPYPNEKDYTRTTRLESVLLGFIHDRNSLRAVKGSMLRSNTRNVFKDDDDDKWADEFPEVQAIANAIEARRIELGKTSGFERLYPRVTRLYFGGMARHLADLRTFLRPGAHLAYVVGDQASYLRVHIPTGQILGGIAEKLGYRVLSRDLFRTRLATATAKQLREEVLVLRWRGG